MINRILFRFLIGGIFAISSVVFGSDDGDIQWSGRGEISTQIQAQIKDRQSRISKGSRRNRRKGRGQNGHQNGGGVSQPSPVVDVPVVDTPVVDVPVTEVPGTVVSFKQVQTAMRSNCTSCHDNYDQFAVLIGMVNTASPASSRLYKTIYGGHGGLDNADVSMILKWIESGAMNN